MIPARLYPRLGLLFSLGGAQVRVAKNQLIIINRFIVYKPIVYQLHADYLPINRL